MRKTALVAGVLYLITIITSIPALALKGTVRDNVHFILGSGSTTGVVWAGSLEVILALAGIGTAVVLFPVRSARAKPPRSASSLLVFSKQPSSSLAF